MSHSGAPEDLRQSGNVGRVWRAIDRLVETQEDNSKKITQLCEDVAFIKGKLEGAQVVEDRSSNYKTAMISGITAAIVGGVVGLFAILLQ